MGILIKTPFRSNRLETDPYVYGLRPEIVRSCVVELFNDKSILITGARGIGKSSLSYQLQRILKGDKTILGRCGLNIELGRYITISYICTPQDTLETIISAIMEQLENRLDANKKSFAIKESSLEVSLVGMIKGAIKIAKENSTTYNSLVENFVTVMNKFKDAFVEPHINISIDELDQINMSENIAHFIKAVIEKMSSLEECFLSFILVGQEVLYQRLYNQQPAFHRLIRHVQLNPLDDENTEYVFDACLKRASVLTEVDSQAKQLLLSLTGGYPAIIQLLGHETFNRCLENHDKIPPCLVINYDDVLGGIKNAIISEKARYDTILSQLTDEERGCIITMADISQKNIPFIYEFSHVVDGLAVQDSQERVNLAISIIESLINQQVLIFAKEEINTDVCQKKFSFREELLRIYLNDKMHNETELDYD